MSGLNGLIVTHDPSGRWPVNVVSVIRRGGFQQLKMIARRPL